MPSTSAPSEGPALAGRPEGLNGYGTALGRVLALSDGIFGFAMTLLVINIAIPATTAAAATPQLIDYLSQLRFGFVAYVLAFLVVVGWWNCHHRMFGTVVRYDPTLLRLNNLFLLCISVTPFLMALVFAYGPKTLLSTDGSARLAVELFGTLEVVTGLLVWGIWRYASTGRRLIDPGVQREWIEATERENVVRVGLFALSVGAAFALPQLAIWMWALAVPVRRFSRMPVDPGPPAS